MKGGDKTPISKWAMSDRPREKLLERGKEALTDAELIAILIGSGNNKENAVDLARRILNDINSDLIQLSKLNVKELMKYNGMGEAKSITIVAALELGRRRRYAEIPKHKSIKCSNDAFEVIYPHLSYMTHEEFWILLLNNSNVVIKSERIGMGGINSTTVDPRIVFKQTLDNNASNIILCHNHPSGNITPSDNDIRLTKKLAKAGEYLDIKIFDHIIVGNNNYYSFADDGMM